MKAMTLDEVLRLPVPERIRVVETIWDSIAEHPEAVPLTDEQKAELDSRLDALEKNPQLHASIYRKLRRALVRRFPYGVFYVERADDIVVVAVLHTSRDPRLWRIRSRSAG